MIIIIPARKNSKGLPFKNRILFDKTASRVPRSLAGCVYVTSDDEEILDKAREYRFNALKREDDLSLDTTSTREVIEDVIDSIDLENDEDIFMLYLTYPERTWEQVEDFIEEFKNKKAKSMLCKKEVKVSPYLMMFSLGDNKGEQVIQHDLYRRQDYPECFEISHFMFGCKTSEVKSLNNNLYNTDTLFYSIGECVDVDLLEDLKKYENKNNS